jgi:hypothetical protein
MQLLGIVQAFATALALVLVVVTVRVADMLRLAEDLADAEAPRP